MAPPQQRGPGTPEGPAVTLTEFLTARIDEDEAVARAEAEMQARFFGAPEFTITYEWARITRHENGAQGSSFARGCPSPARVLAECEAKRRIVLDLEPGAGEGDWYAGQDHLHAQVLRALALPYADHPDYQQEWKP